MHVSLTNCNQLMEWDATAGTETRRFSFPGETYGPESTAAFNDALTWIEDRINAAT